jgi:hypothetical protein
MGYQAAAPHDRLGAGFSRLMYAASEGPWTSRRLPTLVIVISPAKPSRSMVRSQSPVRAAAWAVESNGGMGATLLALPGAIGSPWGFVRDARRMRSPAPFLGAWFGISWAGSKAAGLPQGLADAR